MKSLFDMTQRYIQKATTKMHTTYPKLRALLPNITYTLLGGILFILPALINKFPIVNSDTGCYLYSGFMMEGPAERPLAYGLTIKLFSINVLFWEYLFHH